MTVCHRHEIELFCPRSTWSSTLQRPLTRSGTGGGIGVVYPLDSGVEARILSQVERIGVGLQVLVYLAYSSAVHPTY